MRESEMRRIVQRLHWLVKARRSTATSTTQVRAHIAHDAHGGVHLVGAHTRHFTARDAFKLGAKALREHVAAGGDAGAVAQAELDRRAEKRSGAPKVEPAVAPAPEAVATPRRARKPKAEEPVSTLPAWVPKPKRGGRYSKDERSRNRTSVYHGDHPDVAALQAEGKQTTARIHEWMARHNVEPQLLSYLVAADRYTAPSRMKVLDNVFQEGIRGSAHRYYGMMGHVENTDPVWQESNGPERERLSTPAGLAQWWSEHWTPSVEHHRAAMNWWWENRGVMDPLRDPERVVAMLRDGYAKHVVSEEQAERVLKTVLKVEFLPYNSSSTEGQGQTSVRRLLQPEGSRDGRSLQDAITAHAQTQRANSENKRLRSAAYHAATQLLADAFKSIRAGGGAPHHSANLTRRFPGLKIEVRGDKRRGFEVQAEGGPLDGAGLKIISDAKLTRAEAWRAFEDEITAGAALPPGQHWATYSRARPMGKARMQSIVRRLHALAHPPPTVYAAQR